VAEALGDVSDDAVWRVMRKHDLHLNRRQSWCVSTDPEFSRHCTVRKLINVAGRRLYSRGFCLDEAIVVPTNSWDVDQPFACPRRVTRPAEFDVYQCLDWNDWRFGIQLGAASRLQTTKNEL
jgi:hypothetical protein